MLRMSKLTDYGTVVMTYLASAPGSLHTATEVASQVHVAPTTVSKILKALVRQGLVSSQRGAKGGYTLARPAEKITVAEVIGAMEGSIALTECSSHPGVCLQESFCSIRGNWQRINTVIRKALEDVTLAEMTQPIKTSTVSMASLKRSSVARTL